MNERTKKLAKQARLFHELLGPSVETRYMKKKEVLKLWSIVELGLGGYVIGRSVEKIVPAIAGALKK